MRASGENEKICAESSTTVGSGTAAIHATVT